MSSFSVPGTVNRNTASRDAFSVVDEAHKRARGAVGGRQTGACCASHGIRVPTQMSHPRLIPSERIHVRNANERARSSRYFGTGVRAR